LKLPTGQRNDVRQFNHGLSPCKRERRSIDLKGAAHYFQLTADQGADNAQSDRGFCPQKSECLGIDCKGSTHSFKPPAVQLNYQVCFPNSPWYIA
jgi:hypothetical protein